MQDGSAHELTHPDGYKNRGKWGEKIPQCLSSSRNEERAGIQSMENLMAETLRLCLARFGIRE